MAQDLDKEFDNEIDLSDAFDAEENYTPPSIPKKLATKSQAEIEALVNSGIDMGGDYLPGLAEAGLDAARGVGKGLMMNSVDEVGGALSAVAERPISYAQDLINGVPSDLAGLPDSSNLGDRYRQNQQDIQGELETSAERSPWLDVAGQIAGGMTSGSIAGGLLGMGKNVEAAKPLLDIAKNDGKIKAGIELLKRGATSYSKALPAIAAEGALSSKKGNLETPEGRTALAEDTIGSALFGIPAAFGLQAVTDVGLPAAGKALNATRGAAKDIIEDSPLLRQMKVAYGYGEQGINPRSSKQQLATELGVTNLAELDNTRTKDLMKKIYVADAKIGQAVGSSLDNATSAGVQVNLSQDSMKSISQLQALAQQYPDLADNSKVRDVFGRIANNGLGNVTPTEANDLIKYTDAFIGKFKNATNKTPLDESVLANLMRTRKDFSATLKNAVPEYAKAAERMASFRTLVPETIIARNRPVDVTDTYFGNLKNQDQKLFDSLKNVIQGTTKSGTGASESRTAFVNTVKGLKQFETDEAARIAAGEISGPAMTDTASAIEDQIKKYSDDAVARGSMDAIAPQAGVGSVLKEGIIGHGAETGRSLALTAANKAGLITNKIANRPQNSVMNSVAKLGRGIYNAPNDTVQSLATKLKNTQGLEKYGKTLEEAVNSGSNNRKNQALFTILQNPSARAVIGDGTEADEEN